MTQPTTKPLSILITDDDQHNRAFLSQLIQSAIGPASITEAENGESAIEAVNHRIGQTHSSFDIIFMDYKMPGLNGQETTFSIRQLEDKALLPAKSMIITWSSAKDSPYHQADDWMIKYASENDLISLLTAHGLIQ